MRPCLGCGHLTEARRCAQCQREADREARSATRQARPYTSAMRDRRLAAVTSWRLSYGDWCPGWLREPHPAGPLNPLCADHITPVSEGGHEDGPLSVLCRVCNSSKGGNRKRAE